MSRVGAQSTTCHCSNQCAPHQRAHHPATPLRPRSLLRLLCQRRGRLAVLGGLEGQGKVLGHQAAGGGGMVGGMVEGWVVAWVQEE